MKHIQTLSALFSFPGFRARSRLRGVFGDPHARLVTLVRRKQRRCARVVERGTGPSTTARRAGYGSPDAAGWRIDVAFEQRRVACSRCRGVKVERLDWLAQNPRSTQRFAHQVGTLCRDMSNKAVAQLLHLHEHTVKDLDTQSMQAWLTRTPQPPRE
ncbi:MAG: helix-turn-helix domain-containing protein [Nitrospira sp.]|nr:helix-turn-helix domain-containing protein [Nitrospira sp.]